MKITTHPFKSACSEKKEEEEEEEKRQYPAVITGAPDAIRLALNILRLKPQQRLKIAQQKHITSITSHIQHHKYISARILLLLQMFSLRFHGMTTKNHDMKHNDKT